jgi:SAM-dependent methyltransferase
MNHNVIEKESNSGANTIPTDFYQAFMEHFRGSYETIKIQLKVYLPFIHTLTQFYPDAQILDLGSGRGEWLELLKEQGISAYGVDTNERLITSSKERALHVICANALDHLKRLSEQSLSVITAFHLVEHLAFDELQKLVEEAHRILLPGGLLILETPNPENILVGTSTFYIDPTHQKPIPPDLLAFLPKYYGFSPVKILRLQKGFNLKPKHRLTLFDVLSGVSPDYSVIAQKKAPPKIRKAIKPLFEIEYGVNLEQLAAAYSQQLNGQLNSLSQLTDADIKKNSSFKLGKYVKHQFYNELQTIQSNFKKQQFYKVFRNYWRSLEKKTGKQRHLLKEFFKQAYLSVNQWSFSKQNNQKSEPMLGHILKSQIAVQVIPHPSCLEGYIANSNKPQILIDISELVKKDHRTGVQRVVRSILLQWLLNHPENWTIQPVYATKYDGYRYARRFTLKLLGIKKTVLNDDPMYPVTITG